ncbi:MAG: hypothetical protein GF330_06170 [Candidatus Eisenbacteria bacterium]|nr:hypothetical protein [Candidatus Eisenbacteria bacterium]
MLSRFPSPVRSLGLFGRRLRPEAGSLARIGICAMLLAAGLIGSPVAWAAPAEASLPAADEILLPSDPALVPGHTGGDRDLPVTWYGYVDGSGNAVEGETWTFDHDVPATFEGWSEVVPEQGLIPWRQIDSGEWAGHDNPEPPPIITGLGSAWAGLYQDEADSLAYVDGIGYGNDWRYRFSSPSFTWDEIGSIGLSFDYWADLEAWFDYVHLFLVGASGGVEVDLHSFTGVWGDMDNPETYVTELTATHFATLGENEARIVFEIESDAGYSDEDGDYPTVYGPFAFDDLALTDHVVGGDLLYDFESGAQGFVASDPGGASGPSFSGIAPLSDYDVPCDPCPLAGHILHFHDGSGGHPEGQYTMLTSPPAWLPDDGGYVFSIADLFADMELYDGVFYRFGWIYMEEGGDWSERVGDYVWSYNPGPECYSHVETGWDYVPSSTDAVKLVIELIADCDSFGIPPQDCGLPGNETPLFDNLRIGAIHPDARLVPHLYPTIQQGIDATDAGNPDVLVWSGSFQGDGNTALDFSGEAHPVNLHALFGLGHTAIRGDETHTTGFALQGDTQADAVVVDGFILGDFDGEAVLCEGSSRPFQFVNCQISGCNQALVGEASTIALTGCGIHGNAAGCDLTDCVAQLTSCTIAHNASDGVHISEHAEAVVDIDLCILWGNGGYDLLLYNEPQVQVLRSAVAPYGVYDPDELIDWGSPDENVYVDPYFCDPVIPPVETFDGDYRLDATSPCLAMYSPSGEEIGAYGLGCDGGVILPTPTGMNVEVPLDGIVLTFDEVTGAGDSRRLTRDAGPEVPVEYLLVPADPAEFHFLTTTAEFVGSIEVCVAYDEEDVTMAEEDLELLHFDTDLDPPAWVDITTSVDVEQNIICGVCATLSPFVVAEREGNAVEEAEVHTGLFLHPCRPNPALGRAVLTYDLPTSSAVQAEVFDITGHRVRVLLDGKIQTAGRHQLVWDGRDARGRRAEAGCYFYRLQAGELVGSRQFLLVR